MMDIDITSKIIFKHVVIDRLNIVLLKRCICRNIWVEDWESPVITKDKDKPYSCPMCLREFYFIELPESSIKIFEKGE